MKRQRLLSSGSRFLSCRPLLIIGTISFAPWLIPGAFAFSGVTESHTDSSEHTDTLPDVEVTSRKATRELTSATPYFSLDSKKMLLIGVSDFAVALNRLPGVNLRDYGGAGGLKTVSVRGLGAKHTGVMYDGIPLSDARSGEIDLSRYHINNLKNISLSTGDSDDIFIPARAAASAATLSIVTGDGIDSDNRGANLTALLRAGGFGLWNPYLQGGWSDGEKFSTGASFEFIHARNDYPFTLSNGSATERLRRSNSMMNSFQAEYDLIWKPDAASSLQGKIYYYNNKRQLPGPVIYYLQESDEKLHDRNFFGQLRWRRKLSSKLSLAFYGKFNWSASHYTDKGGLYPGGLLDQSYFQREVYASGALLYLPSEGLALNYSADWIFNNLNSNLPSDSKPYRNMLLQMVTARYNIWRLTATARLLHSLYVDNSRIAEGHTTESRLSPSVSVSLRPIADKDFFVRASYKNIFRAPTFSELYFDHYGTINLKPEITDQFNVGITWKSPSTSWLDYITATADGYVNLVSNKIVAIPYNLYKWTMTNLGKVRVFGSDITLEAQFPIYRNQQILISGSYSYQRAQPRTSPEMLDWMKQVAYTPLNSGSGSVSWLNPWVSVTVHCVETSARYTTNANLPSTRIPGYADFGASIFHTFHFKGHSIEARADMTNLLDKQYEIVARYPMPGRNWSISLKFEL